MTETKMLRVVVIVWCILAPNVLSAAPASQTPAITYAFGDVDLVGPPCGSEVLEFDVQGNQLRIQLLNHAVMVSEDPRLTGLSTIEVLVKINEVSGRGVAQGSLVLEPSGFAGTWEADFNIYIPGGTFLDIGGLTVIKDARINARGTGVFEGQWFLFTHALAVGDGPFESPVTDPDGAGGCEFAGEVWSGRILDPGP